MKVIFDLDGTLADCTHRIPLLEKLDADVREKKPIGNEVWEAFYRASIHDKPIWPVINTLTGLRQSGAQIEIWTGRSDFVREETEAWLARHAMHPCYLTNMRPHGNHIPDHVLKKQWLEAAKEKPHLVFEDRARVVEMWRANGITCCQVAEGNF
jgi:beta-phosphoglucomutase-like phosphatase (HAD superfamily)